MNTLSSDDLYLHALANPENFPGDALTRLLFQRQLAVEAQIRENIMTVPSTVRAVVELILDDSWRARFPTSENAKGYESRIGGRACLLEKLSQIVDSVHTEKTQS